MRFFMLPYQLSSQSGKALAQALNIKRIRNDRYSAFHYRTGDCIFNWGSSGSHPYPITYNSPYAVRTATNKVDTFKVLNQNGLRSPDFTLSPNTAYAWQQNGLNFYARSSFGGCRGQGLFGPSETRNMEREVLDNFAFFTKAISSKREFRVHVFGTNTLVLQKKRRNGTECSSEIRNHANNWVFCRNNLKPYPSTLTEIAIKAIQALGLHYGGVDILLNNEQIPVVLEINTAPGLENSTLTWYIEQFQRVINEHRTNSNG